MRFALALVAVTALWHSTGCQDSCATLADRICDCELTTGARQACRTDRISNQISSIKDSQADQDFCTAKLATCTCDALDNNDLDACGFVPEGK